MKSTYTFKLDPDLISELKSEAVEFDVPFNRYVETLLKNHPYRLPKKKKKYAKL